MSDGDRESNQIRIVIPGVPVARKAHRKVKLANGKSAISRNEKDASFQNLVMLHAGRAMAGRAPFDEPVFVEYMFIFPAPQSLRKRERERIAAGELLVYAPERHDGDNLMKEIGDALNNIVFTDDHLITDWAGRKRIGAKPCTILTITPLSQTT